MEIRHFDLDEIKKYIMEELPEKIEIQIGEHLAECQECRELAQQEFKTNFLFDSWTAKTHGLAYWQSRIKHVLQSALKLTNDPTLQKRLEAWMKKWKGKVGGMVQVLLSTAEKTRKIITDFPQTLYVPHSQLKFAEASKVLGDSVEKEIKITSEGEPEIQVITDIPNKKVIIYIEDSEKSSKTNLIILASEKGEPVVAVPKKIEGTNFYGASFEDIPGGEYTLLFEPGEK